MKKMCSLGFKVWCAWLIFVFFCFCFAGILFSFTSVKADAVSADVMPSAEKQTASGYFGFEGGYIYLSVDLNYEWSVSFEPASLYLYNVSDNVFDDSVIEGMALCQTDYDLILANESLEEHDGFVSFVENGIVYMVIPLDDGVYYRFAVLDSNYNLDELFSRFTIHYTDPATCCEP